MYAPESTSVIARRPQIYQHTDQKTKSWMQQQSHCILTVRNFQKFPIREYNY